jgi:hypothetical protein
VERTKLAVDQNRPSNISLDLTFQFQALTIFRVFFDSLYTKLLYSISKIVKRLPVNINISVPSIGQLENASDLCHQIHIVIAYSSACTRTGIFSHIWRRRRWRSTTLTPSAPSSLLVTARERRIERRGRRLRRKSRAGRNHHLRISADSIT